MSDYEPSITIKVDVTNPGQFFACCGLLELADRLWPGAEGWFDSEFRIACPGASNVLFDELAQASLEQVDPDDEMASPLRLSAPFDFALNWWTDELTNGKQLKVWAGSMRCARIANAMKHAILDAHDPRMLFDHASVVYDPHQRKKKVEPFYFDSRRGSNAQSLDIGFAPDSLKMKSQAHPAVEFLCLVGLQRFRPAVTNQRRVFDYHVWSQPLPAVIASAVVHGGVLRASAQRYRFQNAFRTAQKKHKSFLPATPIGVQS